MERKNIIRLLHVLIPFTVMVLIQNLLWLLLDKAGVGSIASELVAFIAASAAAILLSRLKVFTSGEKETASGTPRRIKPVRQIFHLFLAAASLIGLMFVISLFMQGGGAAGFEVSFLSVVSVLIIHPVLEEYIFRKMFYSGLRPMSPIFACLTQAVMFAIIHDSVTGMLYALGAGIVLGVLVEKTGNIIPAIAAHMFINLRTLLSITWLAERRGVIQIIDSIIMTLGILSLIILLLSRTRKVLSESAGYDESGGAK